MLIKLDILPTLYEGIIKAPELGRVTCPFLVAQQHLSGPLVPLGCCYHNH